jgi:membrane-associated phospholipid phosphatase
LRLRFEKLWEGSRREDWLLLLLAAGCVALAYVFVKVGSEVLEGELAGIDRSVRDFVVAHRSSGGTAFFDIVSWLAAKPILIVLTIAAGWLLTRDKGVVVLIALCAIASAEFVDLLKTGFGITRPPGGMLIRKSLSFPSGHTSGVAAIGTLLSYVAVRQRKARSAVVTASVLVVMLVAISRVYLDMHWTSDVLGGALIGTTLGIACCAVYELMLRRSVSRLASDRRRSERSEASVEPSLRSE